MYCVYNKIKTFLNLLEKINAPALSPGERLRFLSCQQVFDVKKTKSLPQGLCLPAGFQDSLVCFHTSFPSPPESHRIIQKGNTPYDVSLHFQKWNRCLGLVLDWRAEPW